MKICTYEKGEYGEIARYTNGFSFEGEFDGNHNPADGTVKNPDGVVVYVGEIEDGIIEDYFFFHLIMTKLKRQKKS